MVFWLVVDGGSGACRITVKFSARERSQTLSEQPHLQLNRNRGKRPCQGGVVGLPTGAKYLFRLRYWRGSSDRLDAPALHASPPTIMA